VPQCIDLPNLDNESFDPLGQAEIGPTGRVQGILSREAWFVKNRMAAEREA